MMLMQTIRAMKQSPAKRHIYPWILGLGKGGSAGQWERTLISVHIAGLSDYLLRKMKFDPHLTHTQKSTPGVPHIKGKIIIKLFPKIG